MRPFVATLAFLACTTVCVAQSSSGSGSSAATGSGSAPTSSSSGAAQQDSAKPAPGSQDASSSQSSGKTGTQAAEASSKKKQKKVWTNDEIASAKSGTSERGNSSGNGSSSTSSGTSSSYDTSPTNYEVLLRRYRVKLDPLRSDLADLDRKIQTAKEAKGNAREDTAAWIAVQEKKRQDVLAKIERIKDEAQRDGVLPGDLRD
jgi:hypothetical protein